MFDETKRNVGMYVYTFDAKSLNIISVYVVYYTKTLYSLYKQISIFIFFIHRIYTLMGLSVAHNQTYIFTNNSRSLLMPNRKRRSITITVLI